MKSLANMGISPATVAFLRTLGHEAKHLHEEGLDRLPDEEILAKARREGAIILTSDLDFGELLIVGKVSLPSVIIFRLQPPMSAQKVNRYLTSVIAKYSGDLEKGALLSVSEKWIGVRHLPLTHG
jgi:predicted nuclease of predicted toxin-antitoxin system